MILDRADEVNQCELIKQYEAIDTQLIVTNIHQPLWQDIADISVIYQ